MTRRVAIALPRVPLPRTAIPRPRVHLRAPTRREVAVATALVAFLAAAYLVARYTSLFAVRIVAVHGAPAAVARDVRAELADVAGTSLVAVDARDVERKIAALPSVRSATVDRSFPAELRIAVEPERPLAMLIQGGEWWLLARSGRVIQVTEPAPRSGLARMRIPGLASVARGETITDRRVGLALRALAAVPPRFPARIVAVRPSASDVTLILRGWVELRLGDGAALRAKLESAAAVLRGLPADERGRLAYLDVSVPARPVGFYKAQVESEG